MTFAGGHHAAVCQVHLEADGVQDGLGVREGGLDIRLGRPQLAAVPAAGVERRLHVQARPFLPAGNHVLPVCMSRGGPDEDPRQELGPGGLPALLGGRRRLPGQADLRALGGGSLQEVGQRTGQWRLHLQVDHLQRPAGVASHGVVQAGHRVELPFPGQDEGLAALRQLDLGTQHVLPERDASLAPGHRVVQDRLGPADGVLLHPAGRAGQKHVQVSGGHVELHGLVGPNELEFRDAFARDRLAVVAAGPPEVVQGPLQPHFGFGVAPGSEGARQEESLVPGYAGSQGVGDDAVLPQDIDLRQEGGEGHLLLATRSFDGGTGRPQPGAVPQGEGDGVRQREGRPSDAGIWRRTGGSFSESPPSVGRRCKGGGAGLDDGFRRLTFRSGGTKRRAATPAWVTSGGMGKGRCQEAQPATSSTSIPQPKSRGTAAEKVEGHGRRFAPNESPPDGAWLDEVPVGSLTPTIQTT